MPHRGQLTIHEKLAAQYLALGMSTDEVQAATDLGEFTLKRLQSDPLFIRECDKARARAFPMLADRLTRRLEEMQEPALEKMSALMSAESEPVQFQAAKDLLNRGPLAPKQGHSDQPQQGTTIHLDQQALAAILGGALNMGHSALITAFTALNQPINVTPLSLPEELPCQPAEPQTSLS